MLTDQSTRPCAIAGDAASSAMPVISPAAARGKYFFMIVLVFIV
ncbi:MAG: hypothetical protein V4488_03120 [Pseudomonadota bacterium]